VGLLFILPVIQRNFNLWEFKGLRGEYYTHTKPSITLSSWLDGSFQKRADKYSTDSFGFQRPLVRTINQIDYSLFKQANAKYVIIGKENCLYETPYIEAHLGMDYIGDSAIAVKVKQFKMLYDTLAKLDVHLQMIFAPGKGSYYEEYIPDYYWQFQQPMTNYVAFKNAMNQVRIEYIDLHHWFRNEKGTESAPLFPLTGIHWSQYGMVLAADTILSTWNSFCDTTLPKLTYTLSGFTTKETKGSDADVEDGLNIFQTLPHFDMAYPTHRYTKEEGKINTAVIADSYYWGLYNLGLSNVGGDNGEFWYYFKAVYPQYFTNELTVDHFDLQQAIQSKDIIALLQTDATLDRFGFGFIEKAYKIYFPTSKLNRE
jgi:hypothetical protein